jgi:DUF1009 family protein
VVGTQTMEVLARGRAAAFVLEAGRTLMLDPEAMIARASHSKIIIVGKS